MVQYDEDEVILDEVDPIHLTFSQKEGNSDEAQTQCKATTEATVMRLRTRDC